MRSVIICLLSVALPAFAQAAVVKAASCSSTDVQAAIDASSSGGIVDVPAGTCEWTAGVDFAIPLTLRCNRTVLVENFAANGTSILITPTTAGVHRVTGCEFQTARVGSTVWTLGVVHVNGASSQIEIDHNYFNAPLSHHVRVDGYPRGVAHHNRHVFAAGANSQGYQVWHEEWAGGTLGDSSWSEAVDSGGPDNFYIEDNSFSRSDGSIAASIDTYGGARLVVRNNYLLNSNLPTHGNDGAGRNRGLRWFEIYDNTLEASPSSSTNAIHIRGGTGVETGNTFIGYSKGITLNYYRAGLRTDTNFGQANGLNAFDINDTSDGAGTPGGAGDGVFESGTAGAGSTDDVLEVPGAGWTANEWFGYVVWVATSASHPDGYFYGVVVSNDADTITVGEDVGANTAPFVSGEGFEIRRVLLGIDQTGCGTTDLLTDKTTTPTPVNLNLTYAPVYIWNDTLNGAAAGTGAENVFEDLHFMNENGSYDGSSGVGVGLLSARPASPSLIRTAYWATDTETLYQWSGSAWSAYWSRYAYPHPTQRHEAGGGGLTFQ